MIRCFICLTELSRGKIHSVIVHLISTTSRQVNYQEHLKFGVDGGGGFLKICLSIQLWNERTEN